MKAKKRRIKRITVESVPKWAGLLPFSSKEKPPNKKGYEASYQDRTAAKVVCQCLGFNFAQLFTSGTVNSAQRFGSPL